MRETEASKALAAVFVGPGSPLELQQIPLPELSPRELLVRVECCGICGSDVRTASGMRGGPTPSILGHEIVGRVIRVCDEACDVEGERLREGDRITWSVAVACGECDRCHRGLEQKCRTLHKYGHAELSGRWRLNGGMAEACHLLARTRIVRLPESLTAAVASQASCATATVAAAILRAGPLDGRRVGILGAGALGLTAAAWAKTLGAEVHVSDPDEARHPLARRMGADTVTSEPRGKADFDCVFEMSGAPAAVDAAWRAAGVGGKVLLVGSVSPSRPVEIDPERVVRRLLTIEGIHNYASSDLKRAVEFLETYAGEFPFDSFAAEEYPLQDAWDALRCAQKQKPLRVLIRPG